MESDSERGVILDGRLDFVHVYYSLFCIMVLQVTKTDREATAALQSVFPRIEKFKMIGTVFGKKQ